MNFSLMDRLRGSVSRESVRGLERRIDDWYVSYGSPHHPSDRRTVDVLLRSFFPSFLRNFRKWDSEHCIDGLLKTAKLCGFPLWRDTVIMNRSFADWTYGDECTSNLWPAAYKRLGERSQENPLVVKAFFDLFCYSTKINAALFDRVRDSASLCCVLEAANRARFDFGGLRNGHCLVLGVIIRFLERNDTELITLLFQYGFTMETSPDYHPASWPNSLILDEASLFMMNCPEATRMFLRQLGANLTSVHAEVQKMFKVIYRSLTFTHQLAPAVPLWFLSLSASVCRMEANQLDDDTQVRSLYPADIVPGEPRKLSHLSRCAIRERLRKNFMLPHGIDSLCIPESLKPFLNLEY